MKKLQEILQDKKDEQGAGSATLINENSMSNDCVIASSDGSGFAVTNSNGLKDVTVIDIPMPDQSDSATARAPDTLSSDAVDSMGGSMSADSRIPVILNSKSSESLNPSASQSSEFSSSGLTGTLPGGVATESKPTTTAVMSKPKSLTNLPMPPGVNVAELESAQTPSPPRQISPVAGAQMKVMPIPTLTTTGAITTSSSSLNNSNNNSHHHHHSHHSHRHKSGSSSSSSKRSSNEHKQPSSAPSSSAKKGLLSLPLPPMVPGSEDLSGDDDIGSPPSLTGTPTKKSSSSGKYSSKSSSSSKKPKGRPRILNRRHSRNMLGPMSASGGKDWGERCVDVFDMIEQIGEGTYGQVMICDCNN